MSQSPVQGIPAPAVDAVSQPVSEQPAQAQPDNKVDPRLEAYARKERALMKMRRELEEQKKAWENERSNYVPKNRFKEDPLSALADVDLDYQKLTETVLNQPNANDPTIRALQNKLRALEERDSQREKAQAETQAQQYEQAKKQLLNDVKLATNGAADYELIEKWSAHDMVVEKIEQSFENDGIVMDVSEACKAVEEYLITEALKVYDSNKIKERLNPKPPEPVQAQAQTPLAAPEAAPKKWQNRSEPYSVTSSARNQINTLTNRMSQEIPKSGSSEQDRRARAIALLKGELK